MLMANTLRFRNANHIERIFDLKGSTVAREVKMNPNTKKTATLKDINYQKIQKEDNLFNLMDEDIVKLRKIIENDVKFLKYHSIMDYSLLLSAERYSAGSIKNDTGVYLDPETPIAIDDKKDINTGLAKMTE